MSIESLNPELLNTLTEQVDTSFPKVVPGIYDFRITRAEVKQSAREGGLKLEVEQETIGETPTVDGGKLPAGLSLTNHIGLTETPKYTLDRIKKNIAGLAQAAKFTGSVQQLLSNPSVLLGTTVRVKVDIQPASNGYAERNVVRSYLSVA